MISHPDPHAVLRAIAGWPVESEPAVVALVWTAEGSTPLGTGARALVSRAGLVAGTVGGGALEAETLRRAGVLLSTPAAGAPAERLSFDLHSAGGRDPGPICGGRVVVLLHPLVVPQRDAYRAAVEALQQRGRGVLATTLRSAVPGDAALIVTSRWIAFPAADLARDDTGELELLHRTARHLLENTAGDPVHLAHPAPGAPGPGRDDSSSSSPAGSLLELLIPRPRLLIVGGGHVGQALAFQAEAVGFEIVVLDDRCDYLVPPAFPPGTELQTGNLAMRLDSLPADAGTYIALVSRGHRVDAEALAACLRHPHAYLGMIGSRRKVALMRRHFLDEGLATPEQLDLIHAPIGIDIGAVTAPEIAASIVAQLISVRRRGSGSGPTRPSG